MVRFWPKPGASGADHLPDGGRLVGAKIVHDDDVAGLEHWHELLLDIGPEALAVDRSIEDARSSRRSSRRAPRKVSVRQWPCGAKPRRRLPHGPQPRSGAMLVLIQVSSMNTSRSGSRPACQERQRCRRRATSVRACSRATIVFFETQPLAPQEVPHRVVRDLHTARRKFVLQSMQRQMRRLVDPFHDERPVRLQNTLAVAAHLTRRHRRPIALRPLHRRRDCNAKRAATERQLSPASIAPTTRSRRSFEMGAVIRCWPTIQTAS